VKDAKLQAHRLQFEQLKMNDDETVRKYFLRVEELVNIMKGLGETIDDTFLVRKILRSLPDRFNPKVSAIEELDDLKNLTMDQLLGTLTTYEMRIVKEKPTTREASFKADKGKIDKDYDYDTYGIEEKFVRRLKKGTGKYKGKLPLNVLTVVKLVILHPSSHTKRRTMNQIIKKRPNTRSSIKKRDLRRKSCV
jgi:hypothetical protein